MQNDEGAPVVRPPEPPTFDEVLRTIRSLTKLQQEALSRICIGDDSCLNPNTAKALAARGLIDYELVGGLYRAEVASIAVHYVWCQWCSETFNLTDEEIGESWE